MRVSSARIVQTCGLGSAAADSCQTPALSAAAVPPARAACSSWLGADVGRFGDVLHPQRVGQTEGLAPLPYLQSGRDMEDAQASVARRAAIEQPLRSAGQGSCCCAQAKGKS